MGSAAQAGAPGLICLVLFGSLIGGAYLGSLADEEDEKEAAASYLITSVTGSVFYGKTMEETETGINVVTLDDTPVFIPWTSVEYVEKR